MIRDEFKALLNFLLAWLYTLLTSLQCINYSLFSCIDLPLELGQEEKKSHGILKHPKNNARKLDFPGNMNFKINFLENTSGFTCHLQFLTSCLFFKTSSIGLLPTLLQGNFLRSLINSQFSSLRQFRNSFFLLCLFFFSFSWISWH